MISYLDASALVKRYVDEPGSTIVERIFEDSESTGTGVISRAEVSAAFARSVRTGALEEAAARKCESDFGREWCDLLRLQVTEASMQRAAGLAWEFGLRGYDAVHLSLASFWEESLAAPVSFATFDLKLWRACGRIGLVPYPSDLQKLLERWKS